ncbi:nitroreductase/quinone reductase family protein [Nocardia sp. alder85J]|uniref:nitroreductase/quinone reductase family protein n=1 Tax=Nocardia sp. alder85J TaxID=2862949 RepID=UPI001CD646AF|nr:nitroreductase/quinone reductase family protein [Nocardia sp. alder85J]MCX4098946.1 nitroreductase/quinone reductase family protein [Nocardia sp. alder85J]
MAAQFPDRTWGSRTNVLARVAGPIAATRAGSAVVRALTPLDRKVLQRSAGRYTVLGPVGAPILLLTTTGRSSGLQHTTPLLFVHGGDVLHVVGSNFGGDRHPAWTANLLSYPIGTVTIAGNYLAVHAEPVTDPAAREAIFDSFVDITAAYRSYRHRTDRTMRMFSLRQL